jgi:hypothetical protein
MSQEYYKIISGNAEKQASISVSSMPVFLCYNYFYITPPCGFHPLYTQRNQNQRISYEAHGLRR